MAAQRNGHDRRDPRDPRAHGGDRLPRHVDAEAGILGGILIRNEVIADLPDLEVDDFYDLRHKVVFQAMRNLEARGAPLDVLTVEAEIEKTGRLDAVGGIAFLGELAQRVPTADNVLHYAETVRLAKRNRDAIIALSDAVERAYTWPHEPSDLIAEVSGELQRISIGATRERFRLMTIDDALDDLESVRKAGVFVTPFETLNHAIGFGGLLGTQVYTCAAGTGRGKTTFVGHLAARIAEDGTPVLVSVHELGPGYFVARKAAGVLSTHSNEIIRGGVSREAIHRAMPYPSMAFAKRPTIAQLSESADRLAQRYGRAPFLIVDYLQKLADEIAASQTRPDLRLATNIASAALLEIGERTGACIVAVSSIGRGKSVLKNPRRHHPYDLVEVAKESGSVEFDGAGLIVLTLSDDMDGDERIGTITLAKARFGRELHIDARYDGARGTWRDVGEVQREEDAPKPAKIPRAEMLEVREEVVIAAIVAELHKAPAKTKTALRDRVRGCRKDLVGSLVSRMQDQGLIVTIAGHLTLSPTGRQLVLEVDR